MRTSKKNFFFPLALMYMWRRAGRIHITIYQFNHFVRVAPSKWMNSFFIKIALSRIWRTECRLSCVCRSRWLKLKQYGILRMALSIWWKRENIIHKQMNAAWAAIYRAQTLTYAHIFKYNIDISVSGIMSARPALTRWESDISAAAVVATAASATNSTQLNSTELMRLGRF